MALSGASAVREQDRLDIHGAIKDMQNGDPVSADAVEDQISAMNPAPDTVMFVTGNYRASLRHVSDLEAELVELAHEAQCPHRGECQAFCVWLNGSMLPDPAS